MTAKKNKFLALILAVVLPICLFGCQKKQPLEKMSPTEAPVSVYITVGNYEEEKAPSDYSFFLFDLIEYSGQDAGNYFRALCNSNDTVIKGVDDGYITEIGDYQNDDTNAWMFYCGEELALSDKGVAEVIPSPGDTIVLSYIDWTVLFS